MKKQLLLLVMTLLPMVAMADAVEIDGIYYYLDVFAKNAVVTSNPSKYTGAVNIPSSVTYEDVIYSVTSIDSYAFQNCEVLTSVTIPNSVTGIDSWSFQGCSGLTSVTIPNSVTSIGYYAFCGCSGLTSITIPNSVTSIGNNAFAYCSGLTSVHITDIESWCKISFDSNNSNPLYYAHHLYMNGSEITQLVIPNSVTSIGNNAFYNCTGLASITIPNSVTSIGYSVFNGCSSLTSVTIPNSVMYIGYRTFYNCSGLTSVTIPNSVTSIGDDAFYGCSSLTSVTIPNSVTSIGDDAFYGCSSLTSITVPNSVTNIGNWAFSGCSGLTSVTIPNSVTSIGEGAFAGCTGLTSVTIPNSVTSIGNYAFSVCSGLTSVTIPNSVKTIGSNAFYNCNRLTSVNIPNSVTTIGGQAFYYCKLDEIYITDLEAWCNINFGSNALPDRTHKLYLNDVELTNLVIPDCINIIPIYAFRYCSSLTFVRFPEKMTVISESGFSGCNNLTEVELPDDLTIIKKQAFYGCSSLKSITIPAKVEFIYQEAFAGCNALENVKALPTTPPFLYANSFSNYNIPLYVSEEAAEAYQSTSPWSNFSEIKNLSGDDLITEKCATPTIKYIGGKLKFECETEGVEFISHFSTPAGADNNTNEVEVPTTYNVSVYAQKEGYKKSDVATANIDVRGIQGDTNQDGKVTITDAVKVVNIILNNGEATAPALQNVQEIKEPE